MTFTREVKDGCAVLRIEEAITVSEATALRDEMVACLTAYDGLILDLNEVSICDIAGIQLLCSARLSAQDTEKRFHVIGPSEAFADSLARAGFDPGAILGPIQTS